MNEELGTGLGAAAKLIGRSLKKPFVLVDIGARDGAHPRWGSLGDSLEVYGFDASVLVPDRKGHRYWRMAIGDYDGECGFDIPENAYESRVNPTSTNRVRISKLDTLWAEGVIPTADCIKIDCEGYEPQILAGAERYLAASNLLAADVETNFFVSPTLTDSHFVAVFRPLLAQRLLVMDLAMARASGMSALIRPGTCNVLFSRDFLAERESSSSFAHRPAEVSVDSDTILKTIAVLDIYGMVSPARRLAQVFTELLAPRIDTAALLQALRPSRFDRLGALFDHRLPHLGLGIWSGIKRTISRL